MLRATEETFRTAGLPQPQSLVGAVTQFSGRKYEVLDEDMSEYAMQQEQRN